MTDTSSTIQIIAPTKVNLFLHVVGKTDSGYHKLQSLVAFANEGDVITVAPSEEFKFSFDSTADRLPTDENNLVICAANLLASALNKDLKCHIHLTKNIPVGAGLGGGSSDAAATVKALLKFWKAEIDEDVLNDLLLSIGADVPSCYHAQACYFEGVGDVIKPVKKLPPLNALIVYPNQHSSTQDVFKKFNTEFSNTITLPDCFKSDDDLNHFLTLQKNDLTCASVTNTPDIQKLLDAIQNSDGCKLSRMSGSGSACFGLFDTTERARHAKRSIQNIFPEFWVKDVSLA